MMRQAILDSVPDWQVYAQRQRETVFAPGASAAVAQRRRDKMLAAIDFMCGSIEHDAPDASQSSKEVRLCSWLTGLVTQPHAVLLHINCTGHAAQTYDVLL